MRFLACLLMTVAAGLASSGQPEVEVFVPFVNGANIDMSLARARTIVSAIYSEIGVRIVWRSTRSAPSGCSKTPLHGKIVVAFRASASAARSEDAMAFSTPFSQEGPCVTVLMSRLNPEGERNTGRVGYLLGHALAHEIGHVLQGIPRHSETGLMKAHWTQREIVDMAREPLRFTTYDAELVLDALAVPAVLRTGYKGQNSSDTDSSSIDPRQLRVGEGLALLSKAE